MSAPERPEFTFRAIGVCRTPFAEKAEAPRQPVPGGERGVVELVEGLHLEDALEGLTAWSHLWLVFVFHDGPNYRPKVLPPRSSVRRGVLGTRSPHRPNPIGLSVVELERVEGLSLHVRGVDLLDGTPVLDVKPYVPYADAIASATDGWLEVEQQRDPLATWSVELTELAEAQLAFAEVLDAGLRARIARSLALGPQPHAYRRIRREPDGALCLAVKAWRIVFAEAGPRTLRIERLRTGYKRRDLERAPAPTDAPDLAHHRAFVARWG